jgi:hypothetical protein
MAEVYRAKDTRLGRDVAIKVVSEALGADGAFLERFEREAKLAGSLNHPNVVALYDVGLQDGKPYFVTELLQGETLRERLSKGSIPLATALEWAAQMAQGLAAAHERGIVHRDLKPENVFITRDGHVKLLDFGIAKLVEAVQGATPHGLMDATVSPSGGSTGTGMVLGTPGYMSPEQVRGDPVDARTDFFSLGAVLYEMLCGRRAFPAGPVVESGYAILHAEPEPLPVATPAQVTQVVHRCLEKDPGRRFQSARDLAFNLELVRAPTSSTVPTVTAPAASAQTRRWRRWLVRLGVVLAAVGASGVVYTLGRNSRPPTPQLTIEPITFRLGSVSEARFTSDGRVAFGAEWDGQPAEVFLRASGSMDAQGLGLRDVRLLAASSKGELALSLHPIPVYIGRGFTLGTLAVVPVAGGSPRELAENVSSADWSPSDGALAVVRGLGGKRQLEFPLGTPVFETTGYLFSPRVSPRGDFVAVIHFTINAPDELLLIDRQAHVRVLRAFPIVQLAPEQKTPTSLGWQPNGEEVWFSTDHALWAAPLSGTVRLVYEGIGDFLLEDISPNGEVLVKVQDTRNEIEFVGPGSQPGVRLTRLGNGYVSALSDDGRRLLFTGWVPEGSQTFIRSTDGAPPVKLGPGVSTALSPDQKSALVLMPPDSHESLTLLPVGVGVTKSLRVPGVVVFMASWLRNNKQVALLGQTPDKQMHLYVAPLAGGAPIQISPTIGPFAFAVSQDDQLAAVRGLDEVVTLYPLDGGPAVPIPELGREAAPVGWSNDRELWVRKFGPLPNRLLRFDIARRRVVEERTFGPSDPTGVTQVSRIVITPDGRALAFDYERSFGRLVLVNGLLPGRR